MRSSDIVIIGIIIGLFGLIALLLIKQTRDKKLTPAQRLARAEATSAERYRFMATFFLPQGRIAYISSAISSLSVYKTSQISTIVVKLFMISTGLQVAILGVGIFMFGDRFSIMAAGVIGLFAGHITVDREVEKINLR